MDPQNSSTGEVDRAEAARMLAEAEGRPPVSSRHDARLFAAFAAAISLLMGIGTVAIMFSNWALVPYVLGCVVAWVSNEYGIGIAPLNGIVVAKDQPEFAEALRGHLRDTHDAAVDPVTFVP